MGGGGSPGVPGGVRVPGAFRGRSGGVPGGGRFPGGIGALYYDHSIIYLCSFAKTRYVKIDKPEEEGLLLIGIF